MIGLIDFDLQTSTSVNLHPPNLEIMKLATYYRIEENTFCRLIDLNEEELTGYENIYFFSELSRIIDVPSQFLRAKNVTFGGTNFTKGEYIPFENKIIDYTIPRPSIYKEFLKQKYQEGIKSNIIGHMLDDTYYRHYADSEELPLPPIIKNKRVFLYDTNLFQNNWKEMLEEISSHNPSSIYCIHPIICKTVSDFLDVRAQQKLSRANNIILDFNIPLNEIYYMFKKYKKFFIADIVRNSNIFISLGGSYPTNFKYYNDFIYKINLLYSFWSNNIPIKIYYIYPQIGLKDPLQELSLLVKTWSNNLNSNKTLRERFTFKKKTTNPEFEDYKKLIKLYPSANDLFDQNYQQLSQKGVWRI